MTKKDQDDLIWYYSYGTCAFQRSGFGSALEKAESLSRSSDGRKIPRRDRSSWQFPTIRRDEAEPAYTPDLETMIRWARISRRLRVIPSPLLEIYYGDIGARWAATKLGRLFSLGPFTPTGSAALRARPRDDELRSDERLALLLEKRARPVLAKVLTEATPILESANAAYSNHT